MRAFTELVAQRPLRSSLRSCRRLGSCSCSDHHHCALPSNCSRRRRRSVLLLLQWPVSPADRRTADELRVRRRQSDATGPAFVSPVLLFHLFSPIARSPPIGRPLVQLAAHRRSGDCECVRCCARLPAPSHRASWQLEIAACVFVCFCFCRSENSNL